MLFPLRLFSAACVAVMLGLIPLPALATDGFSSGDDLKGWCDNKELNDVHWGLCVGSVTAAHDVVMTYQQADAANEVVCTAMSDTRADVVYAVIDYMAENAYDLDYSLGDVVLSALVDKFPCD